jgi:chromosome segregation ATPase
LETNLAALDSQHTERAEQQKAELDQQLETLHGKHEALHGKHEALHGKHEELHESHHTTGEERQALHESLHTKLETEVATTLAHSAAYSGLSAELATLKEAKEQMKVELQAAVDALQEQHGKELSDLRTDALDRTQLQTSMTSEAEEQVQSMLMEMQNLKEDSAAIERRLTEEFVSVQVTCDRLTRVVADDGVKRELDAEIEARKVDVDMCNEAILALAEQLTPPEVLRPPGVEAPSAEMVRATARADDGSMWRAGGTSFAFLP